MPEHDRKVIIDSQAFKAINLLIDQQAEGLRAVTFAFKMRVEGMFEPQPHGIPEPHIETRVSDEVECTDIVEHVWPPSLQRSHFRPHVKLAVDLLQLKQIQWYLDEADRLERSIEELQRYKLRLLNEYDFTKGDTTEQIAVFGEPE